MRKNKNSQKKYSKIALNLAYMKKVLIITYYWPPAGGPGVQRWLKFSKYLPENGIQPFVLTVDPQFATYPIIDESLEKEVGNGVVVHKTKTRELFSAYKKATNRNQVPYSGFASEDAKPGLKEKAARFVRGNMFFPDPRKGWKKFAVDKAKELIQEENISVIITTGPPHSTHLIALELKKQFDIKWLADFRDPWTDIYYYRDFYPMALTRKLESSLELEVLQKADLITTASPGFARLLANKLGDNSRLVPITNGYDDDDLGGSSEEKEGLDLVITYTGTVTSKYPLQTLVDAIIAMPKATQQRIVINVVGKLDEACDVLLNHPDLYASVIKPGYVSHAEVMTYLSTSTHVLLLIPMLKGNEGIIPAKLFEYIGSGKTIIGIGPRPSDAAEIIEENGFGRFFTPEQIPELKGWLSIPESERKQVDSSIKEKFSRKYLTTKLAEAIKVNL